ncbi:MAG: DinB family protein [Candidatus Rokubacteria bacterium]|nr:DinB family protein [Candidatus Rokubacteria bacterium]
MEGNPAGQAELERLGIRLVPAVAVGARAVHGWNPEGYAALLGVEYRPAPRLAPAALAARLDRILATAERLVACLPEPLMGWKPPQRDRSLRDLGYHLFRVGLAFADAMHSGALPEGWLQETAPAGLSDGPALARYAALVRERLTGWFEGAGGGEYERVISVYYGPQSGHDLLERTTWHAAQHLRQLHALAIACGITPPDPLPVADFEGLPLPASLW